ncbi:hypothetical protein EUGRSUZ_F03842 [Eucalyptus grandis]|uniref:Uncharacterized protein n=2 Tax=Eucalyptus grandis TaxID=71139 RepID=A0ACC3KMV1_EUCGR|nr:hypothetical protein EUGRSUZ_F03842 [Eucalyptus grandis]
MKTRHKMPMYICSHSGTLFPFIDENKVGLLMASAQSSRLETFQDKGKIIMALVNDDPRQSFCNYQNVAVLMPINQVRNALVHHCLTNRLHLYPKLSSRLDSNREEKTTFLQNVNNNINSKIIWIHNLSI